MKTYTLSLDGAELQLLANVLGTQPYNQVFQLLAKLQQQVTAQDAKPSE